MIQQNLFGDDYSPCDHRLSPEERPRLSRQCQVILAMLRERPRSNAELAAASLKYTARISDLRKAGFVIECFNHDRATGEAWYRIGDE